MPTASSVATAKKPATRRTVATKSAAATKTDAISLLKEDHKKVKKMFKEFEKMKDKASDTEKETLVSQICMELTIHAQLEEEIFYPAVRKMVDDDDMMDEATVEHASAKDLIRQLQSMSVADPLHDAKVVVLGEYVNHHVEEEETEMFRKAKKAKLDVEALGRKLATRKKALMREMQH